MGLNDLSNEGTLVWEDWTPLNYTKWYGGVLDNVENKDCVYITSSGTTWRMDGCNSAKPSLCSSNPGNY